MAEDAGEDRADHGRNDDLRLRTGTTVAVRTRFDGTWADGFEIADSGDDGRGPYRVRRRGDDAVLPARFPAEEVRRATPSRTEHWHR